MASVGRQNPDMSAGKIPAKIYAFNRHTRQRAVCDPVLAMKVETRRRVDNIFQSDWFMPGMLHRRDDPRIAGFFHLHNERWAR
jgi:hypothetical protein